MPLTRSIKTFIISALALLVITSCLKVQGLGPELLGFSYVLKNAGTKGEVKIVRDENYLPHIIASNDEDLYFGLGFAMAQDRFGQMDMIRRGAEGRLSEILGSTPSYHGINLATLDAIMRNFRYWEDSVAGYKAMKPQHKILLDAYTRGVNRYLEETRNNPPFESVTLGVKPEPWRPEDSLTIMGIFGLSMTFDTLFNEYYLDRLATELGLEKAKDFIPTYPSYAPIVTAKSSFRDLKPFLALRGMLTDWFPRPIGSNNWVVGSSRSAGGKAMLANDPHVPMNSIPTFWYHCHLKGGSYDVMGMMFPGFPAFGAASNGKIAWGLTNVQVDHIDLFREKVNPKNPNQYLYNNQWEEFRVVTGEIKIKGKKHPQPFSYRMTRHGFVIETGKIGNYQIRKWAPGEVIAVKTVDVDLATFTGGYFDLPKATNWEQFREVCSRVSTGYVGWNHVYADIEGNIGYQMTAHVPIRADNQGILMHEGWTGKGDWMGYVPFDKLPYAYNPPRGYLLSANNKVEQDGYPYYIAHTYLPWRATRINEFLASKSSLTVKDMMNLHADTVDIKARNDAPYIIEDLQNTPDTKLKKALEILSQWKEQGYRDDVDLAGPCVFHAFMEYFPTEIFIDEMGKDLEGVIDGGPTILYAFAIEKLFPDAQNAWFDDVRTPERETRKDITERAMKKALEWLSDLMGPDMNEWKWGRIHKLTLAHPMAIMPSPILRGAKVLKRGPFPLPGGKETVNNAYYLKFKKTGFFVMGGSSSRFLVDFSHPEWAYMAACTGMSANPVMPNYDNLTETWKKVEYIEMHMDEPGFSKNARGTLKIMP